MCRVHRVFIVCITCSVRLEFPCEILTCRSALIQDDTVQCARPIEQTSKVIGDRQCIACEREQGQTEPTPDSILEKQCREAELERWEQEFVARYGLPTLDDEEAEVLFARNEHWGRFTHVGESAEDFGADHVSLNI